MRVLVTGADGFVGQHLTRALIDEGYDVVGGIRGNQPKLTTLDPAYGQKVHWIQFDLTRRRTVDRLVEESRPDAVIHMAGMASVSQSWKDPVETFEVNATGTLHLLQALHRLGAPSTPRPVLLVGSAEAYGRAGTENDPLRESSALQPITPYGASKASQEMLGFALGSRPGLRLIQTRSFPQIGPGQKATFVTVDWSRQLLSIGRGQQDPVLHVGNVDVVRDFLDVREAAQAYVALLERGRTRGVYNVCSGRGYPLRQILDELADLAGVEIEVRIDPERVRPADIPSLVGSPELLERDTGWSAGRELRPVLSDILADVEERSTPA